ncbi:hypothetical protein TSUD_106020 [Trifolium subterraneum]|uniref:Protein DETOXIFICATION n=1 Tax=Trifolium subterraneum TaxID=3900 RepID=A0A2Z6LIP7_TRISU|nr:hypothetical protein TSUD_106020 [Trifolium subterraneum]
MASSNKNVAEEPLLFNHSATPSKHNESDGELERILSDTTVPYFSRVGSASLIELKLLFIIAAPAVFVYLINYVMSMSTQILSGHLGTLELAAASLGNTGIQIFAYGLMSEKCKRTWNGFTLEAFSGLPEFFKLSAASAVMLCLETWYLQILVLLAGLLPDPEVALDSLSICTTISGWVFMISVGFNAAASVRVSNELGARNPKSASFSVVVVTLISFVIAVILALVVLALRDVISYVFTEGEVVAAAVSDLCPLLCLTLVLNGIQPVLSGVAVGCGWQAFVAYVNGIWLGMIGGTFMQTIILIWVTFRTDWNKEVEVAATRLNKLEERREPLLN